MKLLNVGDERFHTILDPVPRLDRGIKPGDDMGFIRLFIDLMNTTTLYIKV